MNNYPAHTCRTLIRAGKFACTMVCFVSFAAAQHAERQQVVALRDLLNPSDPLAAHDLHFDPTFARMALEYLRSQNPNALNQLAASAATAHLLNHARNFDNDVPKDSAYALISHLLQPPGLHQTEIATCKQSLALFSGQMLDDPHWVNDSLAYLPADFRFHGTLFLTFGYDIGVAINNTASLNCAHRHFKERPHELLYYSIHELHHVGFMSYQPPPKLADLKTCADLLRLVEYSTQLEGMAVLAAYQRRRDEHALTGDEDYVALEDARRMQHAEALYFDDFNYLKGRGTEPVDAAGWAVIDRMSSGERLWYRVGAKMARRIEEVRGHPTLIHLIKTGPAAFLETYKAVSTPASKQ